MAEIYWEIVTTWEGAICFITFSIHRWVFRSMWSVVDPNAFLQMGQILSSILPKAKVSTPEMDNLSEHSIWNNCLHYLGIYMQIRHKEDVSKQLEGKHCISWTLFSRFYFAPYLEIRITNGGKFQCISIWLCMVFHCTENFHNPWGVWDMIFLTFQKTSVQWFWFDFTHTAVYLYSIFSFLALHVYVSWYKLVGFYACVHSRLMKWKLCS